MNLLSLKLAIHQKIKILVVQEIYQKIQKFIKIKNIIEIPFLNKKYKISNVKNNRKILH